MCMIENDSPVHIKLNDISTVTLGNISGSLHQLNKYLKLCFLSYNITVHHFCRRIIKPSAKEWKTPFHIS